MYWYLAISTNATMTPSARNAPNVEPSATDSELMPVDAVTHVDVVNLGGPRRVIAPLPFVSATFNHYHHHHHHHHHVLF